MTDIATSVFCGLIALSLTLSLSLSLPFSLPPSLPPLSLSLSLSQETRQDVLALFLAALWPQALEGDLQLAFF